MTDDPAGQHDGPDGDSRRWLKGLAVFAIVALVAGGTAYALFQGSGGTVGSVTVSEVDNLEVQASMAGASLNPGESGDVTIVITNPNTFAVEVTAIEIGDGEDVTGGGIHSEANGKFTNLVIPAGGTESAMLTDAVTLNPDVTAPATTFVFPFTVSASQI